MYKQNKMKYSENEIVELSKKYQKTYDFSKEKILIQKYIPEYSENKYFQTRLKWHERPLFHRDPKKSQLIPRPSLHLDRDPFYTPSQEDLEKLCFVTTAGSDQPYFNLTIELLESLKATRLYKDIPIFMIDCGINDNDKDFLIKKFKVIIKDPGWSIDPEIIIKKKKNFNESFNFSGWKGCTERPWIHKHFPGYQYYFWLDPDLWIQDERCLDKFIYSCKKQKLGAALDCKYNRVWCPKHRFFSSLSKEHQEFLNGHFCLVNCGYCISSEVSNQYGKITKDVIDKKGAVKWGFEMASLNILAYELNQNFELLHPQNNYNITIQDALPFYDDNEILYHPETKEVIGMFHLGAQLKHFPHFIPLYHIDQSSILKSNMLSKYLQIMTYFIRKKYKQNTYEAIQNHKLFDLDFLNVEMKTIHYRTWPKV